MIKSSLKQAVAAAVLVGFGTGAHAAVTDLGWIPSNTSTGLAGTILGGGQSFSEIFTFNFSEPNVGSSYTVVNVPVTVSPDVNFDGLISAISLYSAGANGVIGGGDDTLLATSFNPGNGTIALDYGQSLTGLSYITVTGITNGSAGAIFAGEVIATPVPESETYAMLLAGLGLMGAVVRRRNRAKRM